MNEPKNPNKRTTLNITIDPEIKEWIEKKAAEDERSVSIYVTRILRDFQQSEGGSITS